MPTSPKYLHYKVSLRSNEGTLNIRIYTMPDYADQLAALDYKWAGRPRSLNLHAKWLFGGIYTSREIEINPLDIVSIGGFHILADGEVIQGIPKIDQLPIEFKSRRYFMPLIEAIRDPFMQTWIEITLDQPVRDLSERNEKPEFIYPRKTRSLYWGRLDKHEVREKVNQQALTKGFVRRLVRRPIEHDGTLKLSFMHWMKARGVFAAKEFLDAFKATRPLIPGTDQYINVEATLKGLLAAISPTDLSFATDYRLKSPADSQAQFQYFIDLELPFWFGNGIESNLIKDLQLRYSIDNGSKWSALFYSDPSGSNTNSFYKWKDLAQALFELSLDLTLYPQWEIPTLEEVRTVPPALTNDKLNQCQYWQGCTRWLFLSYDNPPLSMYADLNTDTIEIGHAASWANSYKVDQPTVSNLLPAPAYSIVQSGAEGGSDESYKTLFRLIGQEYQTIGGAQVLVDSPRGFELYIYEGVLIKPVKTIRYGSKTFTSWATFHASYKMDLWGGVRSTLSAESDVLAIEPYGQGLIDNGTSIGQPIRNFGLHDFGEFPLLRTFEFRGGLIVNNETDLIKYLLKVVS
jgi:hypothetical protein